MYHWSCVERKFVRLKQKEQTVLLAYETHGTSEPTPEGTIKPDLSKESVYQPSDVSLRTYKR